MEQEAGKQKGPVDRASDLYSRYQTARFLGRVGQLGGRFAAQVGARAGVAAAGALGTIGAPFWIALGVILGFTLFIVLIGGQNLAGTTPTTSAGSFVPGSVRPPSDNFDTLHENLKNYDKNFGIDFVGFDDPTRYYNYLKWAWEKLEEVKNTKFLSLLREGAKGNIITVRAAPLLPSGRQEINRRVDCSTIQIRKFSESDNKPYPEPLFKVVLIHELSHIIDACNPAQSKKSELQPIIIDRGEGYLTNYSQYTVSCVGGTVPIDEDYAEMIAYFLNDYREQSLGIGAQCEPRTSENPYKTGKFPLHQKLAAGILGVSGPLTPAPTSETLAKFSCPVVGGGPNILPSYQADTKDGHCGTDYNKKLSDPNDRCQGNTRRGKSIDIDTCQVPRSWEQVPPDYSTCGPNGKDVELPTIDGQRVDWQYIGDIPLTRKDCFDHEIVSGCGTGYIFKADLGGGKNWVLHLLHMGTTTIQPGETKLSGTIVGKTEAIHTHISIGKDVPDSDIKDQVKNYWKFVDTEMGLCQ